jgi:MFS family permease
MTDPAENPAKPALFADVTRYQWIVLAIASVGWIFDVFEGQIYTVTRNRLMAELLTLEIGDPAVKFYGEVVFGFFLAGGTVGGVLFGALADRIGRRPTMTLTILMYSVFSGLTYFATNWQQVAALRFLVAMGVGGEWAVAASVVAEVFPPRARTAASGIFHSSSVAGTLLATAAGSLVAANWRAAYLLGLAPALLVLWVRASMREPERWQQAKLGEPVAPRGLLVSVAELFRSATLRKHTLLGTGLAAIGLASFWSTHIAGRELAGSLATDGDREQWANVGFLCTTLGGGLGLLSFAPITNLTNRRTAFWIYHAGALVIVPITFQFTRSYGVALAVLPIFGFFTLGMHAGYAIYFPELFPTRVRGTGTGFCFNVGRLLAAPILYLSAHLKRDWDLRTAVSWLSLLFLLGIVLIYFLPETKDRPLPD